MQEGLRAAKTNLLPGSFLLAAGVLLVVCYYEVDTVRAALTRLGDWKAHHGLAYSIPATAFFGGVMPLLFRRIFLKQSWTKSDLCFQIGFWAFIGLQVDLLYALQAHMFGHGADWRSVLPKVVVDQFVYVPLAAVPQMIFGYLWKDCGFSMKRMREALRRRGYWERSIPLFISNWAIWIPATGIIYSFPLALQMPLQNIILTIWVMLVILLAGAGEK